MKQAATVSKLLKGLQAQGDTILYHTKQFYSRHQEGIVTIYYVDRAIFNDELHKFKNTELFHTTSMIQLILFLRDLLYLNNGTKLPVDNEIWNAKRLEIDYYKTLEKPLSEYLDDKVKN